MKPETADYLGKVRDDLSDARKVAAIGLAKITARSACHVAFHAAEALIVERTGKIAKTHSGLHTEFEIRTRRVRNRQGLFYFPGTSL